MSAIAHNQSCSCLRWSDFMVLCKRLSHVGPNDNSLPSMNNRFKSKLFLLCRRWTSLLLWTHRMSFCSLFEQEFSVFITAALQGKLFLRLALLFPLPCSWMAFFSDWLDFILGVQSRAQFYLTWKAIPSAAHSVPEHWLLFSAVAVRRHCLPKLGFHVAICCFGSLQAWKCQRYVPEQSQACPRCPTYCSSARMGKDFTCIAFSAVSLVQRSLMVVFVCFKWPHLALRWLCWEMSGACLRERVCSLGLGVFNSLVVAQMEGQIWGGCCQTTFFCPVMGPISVFLIAYSVLEQAAHVLCDLFSFCH